MDIVTEQKLSVGQAIGLLKDFDDSYPSPLHLELDIETYGRKLGERAFFALAREGDTVIGMAAYYLNREGSFVYISQLVVHKSHLRSGVGSGIMSALFRQYKGNYDSVRLEVGITNDKARHFYERFGFAEVSRTSDKIYLSSNLDCFLE